MYEITNTPVLWIREGFIPDPVNMLENIKKKINQKEKSTNHFQRTFQCTYILNLSKKSYNFDNLSFFSFLPGFRSETNNSGSGSREKFWIQLDPDSHYYKKKHYSGCFIIFEWLYWVKFRKMQCLESKSLWFDLDHTGTSYFSVYRTHLDF